MALGKFMHSADACYKQSPRFLSSSVHALWQMAEDCRLQAPCRTGASALTRRGILPCAKVIHTVSPRYSDKYHIAGATPHVHIDPKCFSPVNASVR